MSELPDITVALQRATSGMWPHERTSELDEYRAGLRHQIELLRDEALDIGRMHERKGSGVGRAAFMGRVIAYNTALDLIDLNYQQVSNIESGVDDG